MGLVTTAGGKHDAREILTELLGSIQPSGRPGWLPETAVDWLQSLRAQHEAAVAARLPGLRGVIGALERLDSHAAAVRPKLQAYELERRAALASGTTLPVRPAMLTSGERQAQLNDAWQPVHEAHQHLAAVIRTVEQSVLGRRDELWRSHVAHFEADVGSGSATQEHRRVAHLVDDATHGVLAHAASEIAEYVLTWRPRIDPTDEPPHRSPAGHLASHPITVW